MGTVFSIYKRSPKERYEVGKHRQGYPNDLAPPQEEIQEKVEALIAKFAKSPKDDMAAFNEYAQEMTQYTDPGWTAMWSIMGTPNYSVFKMSRWSREELADKLYRASQNIDAMEDALKVADHLLAWAGDDDVTLNPEEEGDLKELGWPTRGYRDAGSIWDAMQ